MEDSKVLAKRVRIDCLKMISRAHASHIASAFSLTDLLAVLYSDVLKYDINNPDWTDRDIFILSKGHAGAAVYATLAEVGFFSTKELENYYQNGSKFSGHVSHKGVPGVEVSTGSLGHGIGLAVGMALARKIDKSSSQVYVIVGDGECDEGSVWEAALFGHQFALDNLTVIVDRNHFQAMGRTEEIMSLVSLTEKWKSFGWDTVEIDGNDHEQIKSALQRKSEKPQCIVANTIKGKGVSFMENNLLWHYRDPQDNYFDDALAELEADNA
ncbi:MAG: transketolase [Streptococcaceae bacterium]|jgi:transketolase|nr:transketolase [Streptococcaceae bacterium]